jgi:hypothetical protein
MAALLLAAPCWALFVVAVAIAWPIWRYASEYALFRRRAVLASVSLRHSAVRRWLWRGHVAGVLHGFSAMLWAALLLAFGALLSPLQWLLLAADTLAFAALVPVVRRRLATDVHATHLSMVARRWPLRFGNVALLALGFFVIDVFIAGAPDTRGLAWYAVAENAFAAYAGRSACAIAGVLIGVANVVDVLTWHAAQVLIPGLPRTDLRVAAWSMALLQGGVVAWAFTSLLLGASALIEEAIFRPERGDARWQSPGDFGVAVLAIGVAFVVLAAMLRDAGPRMPKGVRDVVVRMNPCRSEAIALRAMQPALRADIDRARLDATTQADREVDSAVTALFAHAEEQVDGYLDWYFSLLGEYQRLGAAISGNLAKRMQDELERRIVVELRVEEALEEVSRRVAGDSIAHFEALVGKLGDTLERTERARPCLPEIVDRVALRDLDRDRFRASVAAGSGLAAAVGVRVLAARAASAMAARLATRQGFRAATSVAGKVASRRAGTMTLATAAATACAPGGPLAALCALAAGAVSWLAVDYGLIKIDEIRFRDQMRAEIVEAVRDVERQLAADLKVRQHALIDQLASTASETIGRVFVPARHGL